MLKFNATNDLLPSGFPFTLNTRGLAPELPALYKKYPNNDLQLFLNVTETPRIRFVNASGVDVSINGSLSVKFSEFSWNILGKFYGLIEELVFDEILL
jgi:DNA-binding transcriptional LysR family regulator